MDVLTPDRILTIAGFLGVLVLVCAARLATGRKLELTETLNLGGDSRALLLKAEGQTVLVVMGRRSGTALTLLAQNEGATA